MLYRLWHTPIRGVYRAAFWAWACVGAPPLHAVDAFEVVAWQGFRARGPNALEQAPPRRQQGVRLWDATV